MKDKEWWCRKFLNFCAPPPKLTVSEWADNYRILSPEAGGQVGKYRAEFAPYQREVMDAVHDPAVSAVVLKWGSQLGKTEILNNIVAFFIDQDPTLLLVVQPTIEFAEAWSKERFSTMIRDNPRLRERVIESTSRRSGNTILHKSFPGGNIAIVGANAPTGLAGRARRIVLLDEIDRYPASAGDEGDPVSLAERRTESFWNSFVLKTSTPTIRGLSKIEASYEESDKRQWFCPCPRCGHEQTLKWGQVRWPDGQPADAVYVCETCLGDLTDEERRSMVLGGHWQPTSPGKLVRGYEISGLATPFKHKKVYRSRLHQMAVQFLEAKHGGRETMRVWVNTFLGESFEDEAEKLDPLSLMKRCEQYEAIVPNEVLVLTCGADVQPDRVELEIVGWGDAEECWGIESRVFMGKTQRPEVWAEVDEYLQQTFERADGTKLKIACTLVDSGHNTKSVYQFTRRSKGLRVFPCRGASTDASPLLSRPRGPHKLFLVGTNEAKAVIYSRLKIDEPGPRYMHFPIRDGYDEEYFSQLVAEKAELRYREGHQYRVWVKCRERNEALDIRVYSLAAMELLNPNWKVLAAKRLANPEVEGKALGQLIQPKASEEPKPTLPPIEKPKLRPPIRRPMRPPRPSSWLNSWRNSW